jgi:hypothetical protein
MSEYEILNLTVACSIIEWYLIPQIFASPHVPMPSKSKCFSYSGSHSSNTMVSKNDCHMRADKQVSALAEGISACGYGKRSIGPNLARELEGIAGKERR